MHACMNAGQSGTDGSCTRSCPALNSITHPTVCPPDPTLHCGQFSSWIRFIMRRAARASEGVAMRQAQRSITQHVSTTTHELERAWQVLTY
jgi:hypothetical protein